MTPAFNTLQELATYSKGWAYVLMGITLVCMVGFWFFLHGRDESRDPFKNVKQHHD